MKYRIYILNIRGLSEAGTYDRAMKLLDHDRKEHVQKYQQKKDRQRAIAAGLLLQAGLLEEKLTAFEEYEDCIAAKAADAGENILRTLPDKMQADGMGGSGAVCEIGPLIAILEKRKEAMGADYPEKAVYGRGVRGKPFWDPEYLKRVFPEKEYPYFNLSHSGDYAAIALSDREVGLDIQKKREIRKYFQDYKKFSRLEAYLKCTGKGFSEGFKQYGGDAPEDPGFFFSQKEFAFDYVCNICVKGCCLQ